MILLSLVLACAPAELPVVSQDQPLSARSGVIVSGQDIEVRTKLHGADIAKLSANTVVDVIETGDARPLDGAGYMVFPDTHIRAHGDVEGWISGHHVATRIKAPLLDAFEWQTAHGTWQPWRAERLSRDSLAVTPRASATDLDRADHWLVFTQAGVGSHVHSLGANDPVGYHTALEELFLCNIDGEPGNELLIVAHETDHQGVSLGREIQIFGATPTGPTVLDRLAVEDRRRKTRIGWGRLPTCEVLVGADHLVKRCVTPVQGLERINTIRLRFDGRQLQTEVVSRGEPLEVDDPLVKLHFARHDDEILDTFDAVRSLHDSRPEAPR